MRRHKRNLIFRNVLLGTGALLLYSVRDRLGAIGGLKDSVTERYQTASRRVRRASNALRGEDHYTGAAAGALLVGVAIGVGIGVLFAPASGGETRADVAEKLKDMRDKVSQPSSRQEPQRATGT